MAASPTSASRKILAGAAGALFSGVVSTAVGGFNPFPTDHVADLLVQHTIASTAGSAVRSAVETSGDHGAGSRNGSGNSDDQRQASASAATAAGAVALDRAALAVPGNPATSAGGAAAPAVGGAFAPDSVARILPADEAGAAAMLALDASSGGLGAAAAVAGWIVAKGNQIVASQSSRLCDVLANAAADPSHQPTWRNVVGVVQALARVSAYTPTLEVLRQLWDAEVRAAERALAAYAPAVGGGGEETSAPVVDADDVAIQLECVIAHALKISNLEMLQLGVLGTHYRPLLERFAAKNTTLAYCGFNSSKVCTIDSWTKGNVFGTRYVTYKCIRVGDQAFIGYERPMHRATDGNYLLKISDSEYLSLELKFSGGFSMKRLLSSLPEKCSNEFTSDSESLEWFSLSLGD
ncbi:hypothetical protein DFJ73DRAFT_783621 [Zopfochytrium polystomum]|nr:hypothetical protein DFJ73DRAFT_783621 [Zopfochytrium polystomum]